MQQRDTCCEGVGGEEVSELKDIVPRGVLGVSLQSVDVEKPPRLRLRSKSLLPLALQFELLAQPGLWQGLMLLDLGLGELLAEGLLLRSWRTGEVSEAAHAIK